jgi:hypothetical protein
MSVSHTRGISTPNQGCLAALKFVQTQCRESKQHSLTEIILVLYMKILRSLREISQFLRWNMEQRLIDEVSTRQCLRIVDLGFRGK